MASNDETTKMVLKKDFLKDNLYAVICISISVIAGIFIFYSFGSNFFLAVLALAGICVVVLIVKIVTLLFTTNRRLAYIVYEQNKILKSLVEDNSKD